MAPGSVAWRHAYARGLRALNLLRGGGTHQVSALLGASDLWSGIFLKKLMDDGLAEEVSDGMVRASDAGKISRVMSSEPKLCQLLGLGSGVEYAREASVMLRGPTLLEGSRVVERLYNLFGSELLQQRFGIASPRLRALRAIAQLPEPVGRAFETAGLSAMHAVALAQALEEDS